MNDNFSIVVTTTGATARRSDNNINPSRAAVGEYLVTFPTDIREWLWQATLGAADQTPQLAGSITAELENMASQTLRVRTFNANGAATDRPFHLHVIRMHR